LVDTFKELVRKYLGPDYPNAPSVLKFRFKECKSTVSQKPAFSLDLLRTDDEFATAAFSNRNGDADGDGAAVGGEIGSLMPRSGILI